MKKRKATPDIDPTVFEIIVRLKDVPVVDFMRLHEAIGVRGDDAAQVLASYFQDLLTKPRNVRISVSGYAPPGLLQT